MYTIGLEKSAIVSKSGLPLCSTLRPLLLLLLSLYCVRLLTSVISWLKHALEDPIVLVAVWTYVKARFVFSAFAEFRAWDAKGLYGAFPLEAAIPTPLIFQQVTP